MNSYKEILDKDECEQLATSFIRTKAEKDLKKTTDKFEKIALNELQLGLEAARTDSVHERQVLLETQFYNTGEHFHFSLATDTPPSSPAVQVGSMMAEISDTLELQSDTANNTDSSITPIFNGFTFPSRSWRVRVDQAVTDLTSAHAVDQTTSAVSIVQPPGEIDVLPPPPINRALFNRIANQFLNLSGQQLNNPRDVTLYLYFSYRFLIRMISTYIANKLDLGVACRDMLENVVMFLFEQNLLPLINARGGWYYFIEELVIPSSNSLSLRRIAPYLGTCILFGFILGYACRALK